MTHKHHDKKGSNESEKVPLSRMQKMIITYLQDDLPLTKTPYKALADEIGITTRDLIKEIKWLKEKGFLRRIGAIVRQKKAGYEANAMVAWQVPEAEVDRVGQKMATYDQVSHAYLRPAHPDWPFNLYTMLHAPTQAELEALVEKLAKENQVTSYEVLYSKKEYKKTSMKYF